MTVFKDIKALLDAQDALNTKYVPNWKESICIEQQLTASFTELAEWFESAPRSGSVETNGTPGWKWWKKSIQDDEQNKRVEIIDILHFMMITWMAISDKETISEIVNSFEPEIQENESVLFNIQVYQAGYTLFSLEKDLEKSIKIGLNLLNLMIKETKDMTWEDLENGYYLKNNLNHQRIDGGYSTGEYSKHDENGQEDNRKLNV